ncbi:MAG: ABC transporter ATP-binding protein [Ruminococcaceae bacterium]|nr:ABC transporter ATP-binding protein [Oscillospiraceae bacterium]
MKKLFPFLKPYRKETVFAPFFKLLEACFDLLVPLIVKQIIDVGIQNEDKPYIWKMIGVLCVFAVVGLICALTAQYFAARAAVGFGTSLRSALFCKIQSFSYAETDRSGVDTLITRMTSDVNQIQSGINMTLRLLLRSPIIVLGAVILAFTVDTTGALIFVVVIPLLAAVVFTLLLIGFPLYHRVQKDLDHVTGLTRETLTGVRVIRAFRREEEETERFDKANREHRRAQKLVGNISALMNPLTLLLVDGGLIALLLSGAIRVESGAMSTGSVIALTNYMAQILIELIKFANTVFIVNKALVSAKRVENVLETPGGMPVKYPENSQKTPEKFPENPIKNPIENPPKNSKSNAVVAFENVSMTYEGNAAPSLSHICFSANAGEVIGIIGSTGSGKSTLVNLIPRFYDVTEGSVFVLGKDVRAWDLSKLRAQIGVVPQKAVLFRGTVRSNLLWGNENATDEDLWAALEAAQAKDFVAEKEGGLDAPVAQNGKNFSGGQRQRLTVARALVRKAKILILDDSASALDYATEAALRAALRSLPENPTVFIISQRTASIRHADRILVLEDGQAVGIGTHAELLKNCPVYREIYDSQFKKGGEPV